MKKLFLILALLSSSLAYGASATVNINQASAIELAEGLSGVGRIKAEAIVDYRQKNGNFKILEDLAKVPGIGAKLLNRLRDQLSVESVSQVQ